MLQNANKPMIKAYSYIRMSTERQLSGDSLRRQLELSRKYAADNNLLLDESLKDIGVSAYSGANVESGALGKFLEMVRDGRIEAGSHLIVESLDRLSRKRVLDALPPFIDLLKAGIIIVTLADNQVYSIESVGDNWTQLIMSLSIMARAHEESQRKSDRIKAAIKAKREAALNGEGRYNFNLPSWIEARKTGDRVEYVFNKHHSTIRLVYELAAEGLGQMAICRILTDREIPTFRNTKKGWHQSTIGDLLDSKAVIGTFAPQKFDGKRYVPDGDPKPNFFPAVIDDDLYMRAQSLRRTRVSKGRKGLAFSNLFVGLTTCAHCHGPMTIYYGGTNGKHKYLRCYNRLRTYKREAGEAKQYQCVNGAGFRYEDLEKAILDTVTEYRLDEVFSPARASNEQQAISTKLVQIEQELSLFTTKTENLVEELALSSAAIRPTIRNAIETLHEQQVRLFEQRRTLEADRLAIEGQHREANDVVALIEAERARWETLAGEELYRSRSRVHTAYKRFVDYITFDGIEKTATIIIAGGYRAYRFKDAKLVDYFNAATTHMRVGPSPLTLDHFKQNLTDEQGRAIETIHAAKP
ncbi:DNA invertase Pin-like site-specific DNA recombinase [Ensifer sp. KUDG1]|uniref:recombinase family protein n=1 Tax=Ensifer sp. KUDG1 TaxID=3373919 RepID=UPI003D20834D